MRLLLPFLALVALAVPVRAVEDSGHVVYAKATIVTEMSDADADGLPDATERQLKTDPENPDTDGDGLLDGDEEIWVGSSARVADSDGDGFGDGVEVAAGADPVAAQSFPVTVAGIVSNTVAGLACPLVARLAPTADAGISGCVVSNAAAGLVNRECRLSGDVAPFAFTNAVACGMAFRIEAWADVNGNGAPDGWEPQGTYESAQGVATNVQDVVVLLACDPMADTDGNGLPDGWEWSHFGMIGNSPEEDPDCDGLDNRAEYDHGADPLDEDTDHDGMTDGNEVSVGFNPIVYDPPPTLDILRNDRGYFKISWKTRYSQGYQPKYTDDLRRNVWSNLTLHPLYEYEYYPTGTTSVLDFNTNAVRRFYKLELVK